MHPDAPDRLVFQGRRRLRAANGRRVGLDIAAVERLAAMSPAERAKATEAGTFS